MFPSRRKKIGAFIKTPNGDEYTSQGTESGQSGFNSHIQLIGIPEIIYSTETIDITDYASHRRIDSNDDWEYHNTYVSLKNNSLQRERRIIYVDIAGRSNAAYSVFHTGRYNNIFHYIWEIGCVSDVKLNLDGTDWGIGKFTYDISATIKEMPGALCFTVLYIKYLNPPYKNINTKLRITLYDQYGNTGDFIVKSKDPTRSKIELQSVNNDEP
ncbi:hypothetical protein [Xenorhabdus littoralis]|uniref:hypothetical protein n=1 Tax=Xenorhabdus littoralis TaxID=2582835 RepID=UPI0029E7D99D|nr:hypothetical protein [Xenorhabdus sp. psl]MDX7989910.1 hypothetical protein [Xenorhabdus sp. psl]